MRRFMWRLLNWVAGHFGLVVVDKSRLDAAQEEMVRLVAYADKSGALTHPKRIMARKKIKRRATRAWAQVLASKL